MLSQIVKGILDEPDIRVRGDLPLDRSIVSQLRTTDADVVILADEQHRRPREVARDS